MSPAEILLGFVAILVGIAVADIAGSLHRLLRAGSRVRWHWYPIAAAVLLILLSLQVWWSFAPLGRAGARITFGMFLPFVFGQILLYLVASATLPDTIPEEGIDLKRYYFEQQRYFWLLFAALIAFFFLHNLSRSWIRLGISSLPQALWKEVPNLVVLGMVLSLAFVRRSWWHAVWLSVLPLLILATAFNRPLT